MFMRPLPQTFAELANDIKQQITNLHIADIRQLTNKSLLLVFSETKSMMLALCLEPSEPLITPIDPPLDWSLLVKADIEVLRHHIIKMRIDEVIFSDVDDIIILKGHRKGDDFQIRHYELIIELFKKHPNLILTRDQKIIWLLHSFGIDQARPLLPGFTYEKPLLHENKKIRNWAVAIETYISSLQTSIIAERAKPINKIINSRLKLLTKKLVFLNEDLASWNVRLNARVEADYLLTLENLNRHLDNIDFDGVNLNLDPRYSLKQNALKRYRQYRKAKQAQAPIREQIRLANEEIAFLNQIKESPQVTIFDIEHITNLLSDWHLLPREKKSKRTEALKQLPYHFSIDGYHFSFGKNALQNDYLTFKIAQKEEWFFHIKDHPGAHIILHQTKIDAKSKIIGAMLALILSHQTTGEVDYAQVKTIKKGAHSGQVLMHDFKTMRLLKVDERLYDVVTTATRLQR